MNRSVNNTAKPGTSNVIRTPRTLRMQQRQRFDLSTRSEENEELVTSGLHDLTGQTWNVYAVSALFGFQKDDIHLKLYSKRLREEIASNLARENVTYDAKFSFEENCVSKSHTNHENHPAIKIEVLATTNQHEKETEKSIYKGCLLSWSVTQIETNIQNAIRLPLLLCCGTRSCMDAVHIVLSHMFDCSIIALRTTEEDLKWLVPIIIMSTNKDEEPAVSGELQMEYIVPELPISNTITVKFDILNLRNILSEIIKPQEDINISIDYEHVEMFHDILHTQMRELGSLQLGLCTLQRINLPGLSIMGNKMKVINAEIMDRILIYLNEKAYDTFHILHIDM